MSRGFSSLQDEVSEAVSRETAAQARAAVTVFARSKLAVNGLLLFAAGFFGVWGVVSLQLQAAIISAYVCIFGASAPPRASSSSPPAHTHMLAKRRLVGWQARR